ALQRCPELVEATFAGDALKVQELLAAGADPNSIFLREERIKGSDGCCSCAISWEEYTALIAACMDSKTEKICELLLAHAAIDLNVVCCGLHEFGPYKHFTVRDVARQAKSPLLSRLVAAGALPAAQCAQPPWPREGEEVQEAPLPALPPGRAQKAAAQLLEAMRGHRSPEDIEYSEKYSDDRYEYRHVILHKAAAKEVWKLTDGMKKCLEETQWRGVGVTQSRGWVHYEFHRPEPHILLFRRLLGTDPQTGRVAAA
ncbi:unnamed protein product, partial [Effrenium voratum]